MIGWTHLCVGTLIIRRYGDEIWKEIIKKAGFSSETIFEVQTYYDDNETMRIFRTAANTLGLSVDDMWEMYGDFLIVYACETGWEKMLACMANNLQEFLDNLNSMHYFIDQIAFKSEMRGPTFQCETQGEGALRLHYFSHRQGLFPIVKGLVRRTARVFFDMDVKVNVMERSQERRKTGMVEHVMFSLEPDEDHMKGKRLAYKFRLQEKPATEHPLEHSPPPVLLPDLKYIFPYHICFNKQLVIEHVGAFLLTEYGLADKKLVKLTDVVQLVQPSDIQQLTFKTILTYLNTLFIFQMKHHSKRNEIVAENSSKALTQPLYLKGQMLPVHSGNSIIFCCSPHVTTVRDILDLNLYISDMPVHDATRDLVMLNQSRICQMELNKKLEETSRQMKGMASELEKKREQRDGLLFEFVPPDIAESLRQNKHTAAQEFSDCTVLVADIPDFHCINMHCQPNEIVALVEDLCRRFDKLIEKHSAYKVLSLMDSSLIVGGVPQPHPDHCENLLNLALGMLYEARQVIVPGLNLPVRVRIGMHCGPVVAGVVSERKPRYCILGETVAIARNIAQNNTAGRILVGNSVRMTVTKHLKSIFVFTSHGYVETGSHKTPTHFLERNDKSSIWEIIGREKAESGTIDGYRELHCDKDLEDWAAIREAAARQQRVIDAMRPSTQQSRFSALKNTWRFRSNRSDDSGVSIDGTSRDPNSAVCSLM